MNYRTLGSTDLRVSRLALGAGPVAEVMLGDDTRKQQDLVEHAIQAGINWFDTAPGYGDGQAESCLGGAIKALGAADQVHVATKVRLQPGDLSDIAGSVRQSVDASLKRLRLPKITLLQMHNAVTDQRQEQPDSITPQDVLGPGGVLEAMQQLTADGVVGWLGLTATGPPGPLGGVLESGSFHSIQVPYNLLNPSAGQAVPADFQEADYGNIIARAAQLQMGVFAIRVFAGGALAGNPPSRHTHQTRYFPLELYRRDEQRGEKLKELLPNSVELKEFALRFATAHPAVTSALVGFSEKRQIDEAVSYLDAPEMDESFVEIARDFKYHVV